MGATCVDWQDESRNFSEKSKGKKMFGMVLV